MTIAAFTGYTVWVTNALVDGYAIDYANRRILFAASTARRMARRARRWAARHNGRRYARSVKPVSFQDALEALIKRGATPK